MVNKLFTSLAEGLFPSYCILCGLRSYRPLPLCSHCQKALPGNDSCCYRCAIPLPGAGHTRRWCGQCLNAPPAFDRVVAPWLYGEQLAHLIHRWKYQGDRLLTVLLASLWLQQVADLEPVDVLIPVPLHWRRQWQRGYNQADLLARQLRRDDPRIHAAALDKPGVRRHRPTLAQSGIDARQRTRNLRGAFTVFRRYDNLRVAIVDDVLTTGATASSLAGALRDAGALGVEVWCLARTPAPGSQGPWGPNTGKPVQSERRANIVHPG